MKGVRRSRLTQLDMQYATTIALRDEIRLFERHLWATGHIQPLTEEVCEHPS